MRKIKKVVLTALAYVIYIMACVTCGCLLGSAVTKVDKWIDDHC